ncbi:trehalose 6-phosphate phosphatase [Acrocarpospora corrugata]|uniref:Trehalose 6-phosphate phosphatase n=1 Tax=Acrocarpospora corrugata TaxID=35763 RepID=A0A5M3W9F6_9ACTN|nr:trehalose 6-phosphate phosphatase [Acrocarpospora corrugata]
MRTDVGAIGLSTILDDPGGAVIALDFDGTLAPIVADPSAAWIDPGAPAALIRLAGQVNRVAIITGRPPSTAIALGDTPAGPDLIDVPNLLILGHYGLERWEGGEVVAPPHPAGLELVRNELPALLASLGPEADGVKIEDKGRAVAVHTRNCADPDAVLDELREPVAQLAERAGLVVEPGRKVLELRGPGMDKGRALRELLTETSARSVMFIGDDLGDLAAFAAVAEADIPGVRVCSGSAEVTELAENADLVVDGPPGVVALLETLGKSITSRDQ